MFTGIVEELGAVVERAPDRITVSCRSVLADTDVGSSIAVNGVCLTVVERGAGQLGFDLSEETLRRTTLAGLSPGGPVNLERPCTLTTRLGGHLVQGHVDGVGGVVGVDARHCWGRRRREPGGGRPGEVRGATPHIDGRKGANVSQTQPVVDRSVFSTIEEAVEEIRAGGMVIVVDDADRENEGDFVMAAEKVTPEAVNFMATHGRGIVCAPCTEERLDQLRIPLMAVQNSESHGTAFAVSIDARAGTTTGTSAYDRAVTVRALADPSTRPEDLRMPGHVFPLRAREGGVLV